MVDPHQWKFVLKTSRLVDLSYGTHWLDCTDVPSIFFFFSHPAPEPISHYNVFLTWAHICSWSVKLCFHHIFIPQVAPIYRPLSWIYRLGYVAYGMSRECELTLREKFSPGSGLPSHNYLIIGWGVVVSFPGCAWFETWKLI
jgi:hypothetical protein